MEDKYKTGLTWELSGYRSDSAMALDAFRQELDVLNSKVKHFLDKKWLTNEEALTLALELKSCYTFIKKVRSDNSNDTFFAELEKPLVIDSLNRVKQELENYELMYGMSPIN